MSERDGVINVVVINFVFVVYFGVSLGEEKTYCFLAVLQTFEFPSHLE